jgi:hypothetical protein
MVSRVDLRPVRQALANAAGMTDPPDRWLTLGGLPKLLDDLCQHFEFAPARRDTIGSVPVWLVEGTLNRRALAGPPVAGETTNRPKPGELPEQLPAAVSLVLGRDEPLPLFPYRIEFLREQPPEPGQSRTSRAARRKPVVTLEFYEIRATTAIDPTQFEYHATDEELQDHTDQFIERLGVPSLR